MKECLFLFDMIVLYELTYHQKYSIKGKHERVFASEIVIKSDNKLVTTSVFSHNIFLNIFLIKLAENNNWYIY